MKKSKKPLPEVEIINYGRYARWNRDEKKLPEFVELTDTLEAELDVEFGMIVEIRKAKGRYLDFTINHPSFTDQEGNIEPPFEGTFRVKQNPYRFFLGDTIWEPVDNKKGEWELIISIDETILARKVILLV